MIESISLTNFKLFKERTTFDHLRMINLLTGVNGRGKSTFLQSMLLVKQTLLQSSSVKRLALNGSYVSLGNALDVKNDETSREQAIEFTYKVNGKDYVFSYQANERDDQILELINSEPRVTCIGLDRVQYISAERIGPRLQYEKSTTDFVVGAKGEYAVDVLSRATKNEEVIPETFVKMMAALYSEEEEEIERGVNEQVEFWLSKMFGKTVVNVQSVIEANVDVMKFSALKSRDSKPTNIGFGFSYALPILVAGLTSKAGDLLIIENPEAHLHPSAQSVIAKFLACVAMQGVQVFIESHSEHILNSLRVMIKQNQIGSDDVNVLFFDVEYPSYFKPIPIYKNGRMLEWPDGFFDQAEKDLNILLDL
ncbi:MAG: DUF3696 domain-containing protein [Bacteroidales bacterium]|nr:DUF3696 domain-containing protein [Bacteroidales bacterium]